MRKAGGIVAIVGSCIAVLVAIVTLIGAGVANFALDNELLEAESEEPAELDIDNIDEESFRQDSRKMTFHGWVGIVGAVFGFAP